MPVEEGIQSPSALGQAGPSSSEESEAAGGEGPLKWKTVNVYNAAIAALYHYQVSMGLNKALMKGLLRTQDVRSRDTFKDRGAGGIDSSYSQEEFLQM
jgi:hypothetical protein